VGCILHIRFSQRLERRPVLGGDLPAIFASDRLEILGGERRAGSGSHLELLRMVLPAGAVVLASGQQGGAPASCQQWLGRVDATNSPASGTLTVKIRKRPAPARAAARRSDPAARSELRADRRRAPAGGPIEAGDPRAQWCRRRPGFFGSVGQSEEPISGSDMGGSGAAGSSGVRAGPAQAPPARVRGECLVGRLAGTRTAGPLPCEGKRSNQLS